MPEIFENIFSKVVENVENKNKPFDSLFSNPPYQMLTTNPESKHKSVTNVFQLHQTVADKISITTNMIYPGERWIARTGRNLKDFSLQQLNSPSLQTIVFFPEVNTIFGKHVTINGGLSIVHKNSSKLNKGLWKLVRKDVETETESLIAAPKDRIISTIPSMNNILSKVFSNEPETLAGKVESRMVFGIESNFIEKHVDKVVKHDGSLKKFDKHVLTLTNDVSGPNGRVKWFWVPDEFLKRKDLVSKWKVVVSSADAAATRSGSSHATILPAGTAHGRARVILSSFDSEEEALNFYIWLQTDLIRALLSTTGNQLTSLGANVPLLKSYKTGSKFFKTDLNIENQFNEDRPYAEPTKETILKASQSLNKVLCDFYKLSEKDVQILSKVVSTLAPFNSGSSIYVDDVSGVES